MGPHHGVGCSGVDQLVLHIADVRDQIRDYALDHGALVHRHRRDEIHSAPQKEVHAPDRDESAVHDDGSVAAALQPPDIIHQAFERGHIRGRSWEYAEHQRHTASVRDQPHVDLLGRYVVLVPSPFRLRIAHGIRGFGCEVVYEHSILRLQPFGEELLHLPVHAAYRPSELGHPGRGEIEVLRKAQHLLDASPVDDVLHMHQSRRRDGVGHGGGQHHISQFGAEGCTQIVPDAQPLLYRHQEVPIAEYPGPDRHIAGAGPRLGSLGHRIFYPAELLRLLVVVVPAFGFELPVHDDPHVFRFRNGPLLFRRIAGRRPVHVLLAAPFGYIRLHHITRYVVIVF